MSMSSESSQKSFRMPSKSVEIFQIISRARKPSVSFSTEADLRGFRVDWKHVGRLGRMRKRDRPCKRILLNRRDLMSKN